MFNPYTQFYPSTMPQNTFSMQRQQVIRVNGKNGAEAYGMPPESTALLLDETAPIVWLKSTDGAGYPTIKAYKIEPYEEPSQIPFDVVAFDNRLKRLEDIVNGQSNVAVPEHASKPGKQSTAKNIAD